MSETSTARIEPNPYSPYADADPRYRHIFPAPVIFGDPVPGVLAMTGCGLLAVVPEKLSEALPGGMLPEGLCPTCLKAMQRNEEVETPGVVRPCSDCDGMTRHEGLCALCRQEKHDEWWPTRSAATEAGAR